MTKRELFIAGTIDDNLSVSAIPGIGVQATKLLNAKSYSKVCVVYVTVEIFAMSFPTF